MATNFEKEFNPTINDSFEADPIMADPAHPGDLMREIIDDLGINIAQAAKAAGLQRTHLSAMLSGDKPVSIETAIKFEAAFGGPDPFVIHGMSDYYESNKAIRNKDRILENIVRLTEENLNHLRAISRRKPTAKAA